MFKNYVYLFIGDINIVLDVLKDYLKYKIQNTINQNL